MIDAKDARTIALAIQAALEDCEVEEVTDDGRHYGYKLVPPCVDDLVESIRQIESERYAT